MVDHISECRKRIITFFCLFILCSQCPSSIKTKAEEYNQCLHWIQKVRGIFVLFSWLKAPSVPLIDTKQKLYYTTHGCCLCALKCVFGLHWPWGHIFFCCRKKLSSHVENWGQCRANSCKSLPSISHSSKRQIALYSPCRSVSQSFGVTINFPSPNVFLHFLLGFSSSPEGNTTTTTINHHHQQQHQHPKPPANDHPDGTASCKWSSRWTGPLQMII